MNNLTAKELDVLVDALETWEHKESMGMLMDSIFSSMLTKDAPPEMVAEIKRKDEEDRQKYEREKRERKEISLMLRAKLVGIKQELLLQSAVDLITK